MTLFEWSTPERRRVDQILPTIPNEIYICIFEHISPPTARLTPKELLIFTMLSGVCRFFANFCLPRAYESLEFGGTIFRNQTPSDNVTYRSISRGSRVARLCTQIAAKQPLALSLAKTVRRCDFASWGLGILVVRLLAEEYLAGTLHTTNIREVVFHHRRVDAKYWSVIATLESLEGLSFEGCEFLHGPADVEPEERVKVSRLRIMCCCGDYQAVAAIHPQYLHTLTMDCSFDYVGWLHQSGLIELYLFFLPSPFGRRSYSKLVHALLMQAPPSLERLWLPTSHIVDRDTTRSTFADPA